MHPNWKYVNYVNNSQHYLNSPKCLLNEKLYHNARQTVHFTKEQRVEYVHDIIKKYACKSDKKTAIKIVEQFENLSIQEFAKLNPNEFRDNQPTPKWIEESIRQTKEYEDRLFGRIIGAR